MKSSPIKFKTKPPKRVILSILDDLVAVSELFGNFPRNKRNKQKQWSDGLTYGVKYVIVHIAGMLDDKKAIELYKRSINWKREQRKLLEK